MARCPPPQMRPCLERMNRPFQCKLLNGDVLNRYFCVTVPSDYFRKDIRYFLSVTCIRLGNH